MPPPFLNIEDKENSLDQQQLIEALGLPSKFVYTAEEWNLLRDKINELHQLFKISGGGGLGSNAVITQQIISNVDISEAAPAGTVFNVGTTFTDFVKKIALNTFFPTFQAISASLNLSGPSLRVIGSSTTFNISVNFNRGAIRGLMSNGSWDANAFQNHRSGVASAYDIDGQTGLNVNSIEVTKTVMQGLNTFDGSVYYNQGPQPLDSDGNPYQTPLLAGSILNLEDSFEGVYPYYGNTASIASVTEQSLKSMLNTSAIIIDLVDETGGNKQSFEFPEAWLNLNAIQSIQNFNTVSNQFDPSNQISAFTVSNISKTIEGQTVAYKRYTHNGSDRGAIKIKINF